MKISTLFALLSSSAAFAGGVCCDTGPGCAICPPKQNAATNFLPVSCPGKLKIEIPDIHARAGEKVSAVGVVTEFQSSPSPVNLTITASADGGREVSFFHPYCTQVLSETDAHYWTYRTNCEGLVEQTTCSRSGQGG